MSEPEVERIIAAARLLLDTGDLTPYGQRLLLRVLDDMRDTPTVQRLPNT